MSEGLGRVPFYLESEALHQEQVVGGGFVPKPKALLVNALRGVPFILKSFSDTSRTSRKGREDTIFSINLLSVSVIDSDWKFYLVFLLRIEIFINYYHFTIKYYQ